MSTTRNQSPVMEQNKTAAVTPNPTIMHKAQIHTPPSAVAPLSTKNYNGASTGILTPNYIIPSTTPTNAPIPVTYNERQLTHHVEDIIFPMEVREAIQRRMARVKLPHPQWMAMWDEMIAQAKAEILNEHESSFED